jgi:hypothetical protein
MTTVAGDRLGVADMCERKCGLPIPQGWPTDLQDVLAFVALLLHC